MGVSLSCHLPDFYSTHISAFWIIDGGYNVTRLLRFPLQPLGRMFTNVTVFYSAFAKYANICMG